MNKFCCFIILILFTITLSADFTIEKSLIDTLTIRADENLKNLPEDVRNVYNSYLRSYPDGLMAYLISTENSGTLWDTDPNNLLENYLVLKELFAMEDYEKYPDEFVLSYIAKTTVSHEKLTNYRKVFSDLGLLDYVIKYPDLEERLRRVTL